MVSDAHLSGFDDILGSDFLVPPSTKIDNKSACVFIGVHKNPFEFFLKKSWKEWTSKGLHVVKEWDPEQIPDPSENVPDEKQEELFSLLWKYRTKMAGK